VVDEKGKKMSKSLGNSMEPGDVIKQSGADILRLWVAMSDYTQDIRISTEILARATEAYRKLRNTLRHLLGNLYDFDPAKDLVPLAEMVEVDRYILARYAEMARRVLAAYDEYEYGPISQALTQFVTVDLSAFYNDISKDGLYTLAAGSRERRSAQTAFYLMADGLTRLLAPILSFTADELWRHLRATPGREESVHMALFPAIEKLDALADPALVERWNTLLALRERVLAEIEPRRKNKEIGSSLQAKVIISASPAELELLQRYAKQLPMLFIVSEVELRQGQPGITIERAAGVKCERCWRIVPAVSKEPAWAGICDRCQDALAETVHG
jgi:isoleucyl-tRNA synthetase